MRAAGYRRWLLVGGVWAACAAVLLGLVTLIGGGSRAAATPVRMLAGGGFAGYALLDSGRVLAWGDDLEGQIGPAGGWQGVARPVAVPGIEHVTAIAGGENTAYALESNGSVWAWGDDSQDEVGDGGIKPKDGPRRVALPSGAVAVAAGGYSGYVLLRDGTVWSWGGDGSDQLGAAGRAQAPGGPWRVQRLTDVIELAAGVADGYALRADGTVWAWGDGSLGQLGEGTCRPHGPGACAATSVPVRVHGLRDVVAITAAADSGYALLRDGTVWAWGDDGFGELGTALPRLDVATPVRIPALANVVAIAAGSYTGYALLRNRTLWAWGRGIDGELGDGQAVNEPIARRVALADVARVAAGGVAAYALDRDGRVWAWGSGDYGQLGDGSQVSLDEPVRVAITR